MKVTRDSGVIGRLFRARRTARGPGSSRQPGELGGSPRSASGKMESSSSDFQKPHGAKLERAGEDGETGPARSGTRCPEVMPAPLPRSRIGQMEGDVSG